jgi:dihydrofolate synthase/folylpolyglutamate synthase
VSVITNIGLDHTQFLGNTIEAIAGEKAGITKTNIPVVIGEYTPETKSVFLAKAKEKYAAIYFASELISDNYPCDLTGDYQLHNKKAALQTIKVLNSQQEFTITNDNIKVGLLNVVRNTGLQGRWQQLGNSPKIICDTAHNRHGLEVVLNQIKKQRFAQLHIVLGVLNDKNLEEILPLFPKNAIYYFSKPNNPRGLDATILAGKAKENGLTGAVFNSITTAYQNALEAAKDTDLIYIGGSTFVVAEIL